MGYWEQIGEENIRHRERMAKLPRWRRVDWPLIPVAIAGTLHLGLWLWVLLRPLFG